MAVAVHIDGENERYKMCALKSEGLEEIRVYNSANTVYTDQGFDVRTAASFITGSIPEPGELSLLGFRLLALRRSRWRR